MRASLLLAALLLGCPADEACDPVCPAAGSWYEGCLEQWGLGWGPGVGYEDRADWDNWCATIQLEDRLLAESSEDPQAAEASRVARCQEQRAVVGAGDCAAYYGMWEGE